MDQELGPADRGLASPVIVGERKSGSPESLPLAVTLWGTPGSGVVEAGLLALSHRVAAGRVPERVRSPPGR